MTTQWAPAMDGVILPVRKTHSLPTRLVSAQSLSWQSIIAFRWNSTENGARFPAAGRAGAASGGGEGGARAGAAGLKPQ